MPKKKDVRKEAVKAEKGLEIELTETLVKYDFSQDELVTIGEQVADFAQKLSVLESESKQIAKQYKADIEGVELQQDRMIRFIRDKFEMRKMECFKVVDGKTKKAFFYRSDQVPAEILRTFDIDDVRSELTYPGPARVRDARPSELQRGLPGLAVETGETIEGGEEVSTE